MNVVVSSCVPRKARCGNTVGVANVVSFSVRSSSSIRLDPQILRDPHQILRGVYQAIGFVEYCCKFPRNYLILAILHGT